MEINKKAYKKNQEIKREIQILKKEIREAQKKIRNSQDKRLELYTGIKIGVPYKCEESGFWFRWEHIDLPFVSESQRRLFKGRSETKFNKKATLIPLTEVLEDIEKDLKTSENA